MKTAFLFPGQGAQYPGMMKDIVEKYEEARDVFDLAGGALDRDIRSDIERMSQEELNETRNTQPCMLTCELAVLRVLRGLGIPYEAAVGFSLGEWAAVVAAGAVKERDALEFIARRADAMQRAVPVGQGAMAYLLGKDDDFVARFCEEVGGVVPANYNIRGNVSVAGTAEGIERFLERGAQEGFLVGRIPVSIPSHCWLMQPAADELAPLIRALDMKAPEKRLLMNATGTDAGSAEEIRDNLTTQLTCPVLFRQTIDRLLSDGFDTFVELGPGSTLGKMVKKAAKQQKLAVTVLQSGKAEDIEKLQAAFGSN